MVPNNSQIENAILYCEKQIRRYTKLRNDLILANQWEPGNILAGSCPAPSPTNFPDSPDISESLATGGAGVVPGPAILERKFSPSPHADRGLGDLLPVCIFGQGEYSKPFTPSFKNKKVINL